MRTTKRHTAPDRDEYIIHEKNILLVKSKFFHTQLHHGKSNCTYSVASCLRGGGGFNSSALASDGLTLPGSDLWKVKPTSTGTTTWSTPFGSSSFGWSENGHTTWFPSHSTTWLQWHRTCGMAQSPLGATSTMSGSWKFELSYHGSRSGSFRSFFTVFSEAVGHGTFGGSGSNGLGHPSQSALHMGWSSGARVIQLSGTSGEKEFTLSADASGEHVSLVGGRVGIRANSHPAVNIGFGTSWKKGANGERVLCVADGFGNLTLHAGVNWDYVNKNWYYNSWKTSAQDLYGNPGWTHWASSNIVTSPYLDGDVKAKLGSDIESPTLGKEGTITSQLRDKSDSQNPKVSITNTIKFHKPLENPVAHGIERPYLALGSSASATPLPASHNGIVTVSYIAPQAGLLLDPQAAAVVNFALELAGNFPKLSKFVTAAGFLVDEFTAKPVSVQRQMSSIFEERWPTTDQSQSGRRMGIGIHYEPDGTADVLRHRLTGVAAVFKNFRSQDWRCDTYSFSGFAGIGTVTTLSKVRGSDELIQGEFTYVGGGSTPPPGTGGTPPGGGGINPPPGGPTNG